MTQYSPIAQEGVACHTEISRYPHHEAQITCNTCHDSEGEGVSGNYVQLRVNGEVGSSTLWVRFSEGVYSEPGAVGALTPTDFALTDVDNGRSILNVTHTAGDVIAGLTLSTPLDSSSDIEIDTLAAATDSSIFNIQHS